MKLILLDVVRTVERKAEWTSMEVPDESEVIAVVRFDLQSWLSDLW